VISHTLLAVIVTVGSWTEVQNDDGIKVSKRAVVQSEMQEFLGEIVVPGALSDIDSIFLNVAAYEAWYDTCNNSRQLRRQGDVAWLYMAFDAPWPFENRSMVLETTRTHEQARRRIQFRSLRELPEGLDYPEENGTVPARNVHGMWTFVAMNNGVRVVYKIFTDPGGSVPAFGANDATQEFVFNTLSNLRRVMHQRSKQVGIGEIARTAP